MTPEMVIDVGKEAGEIVVLMAAPPLLAGLVVGLIVSLFQTATSIQEMTLTFIPKLLAVGAALVLGGHWMLSLITDYIIRLYHSIPNMIG
ncbi:flagellar biosynthetic protein FliQ [Thiorhodococcus drewsii AZ1]|uniref:Flagellar biosynthetic protein FliQ n=1 Tax=Thiorhodococcus drewsii AZ1 TaxID=765913 RepID=G2E344_9GAMM|nr:flagellar biosynthesis protein FliQ [Thiorhodococcus drewsii]EGV30506.1 flagellar biosynthetic protein FliQ [Thiorhodococcus drewsii AZ1]